jgi:hypothetical protein
MQEPYLEISDELLVSTLDSCDYESYGQSDYSLQMYNKDKGICLRYSSSIDELIIEEFSDKLGSDFVDVVLTDMQKEIVVQYFVKTRDEHIDNNRNYISDKEEQSFNYQS